MGMNRSEKETSVNAIAKQISTAQAVIVAEYRGVTVGQMTALRKEARTAGVYLKVLKNTLARRAITGTPFAQLSEQMTGPLVYAMADDPVACAKLLDWFAKDNEKLVVRAGALPGQMLDRSRIKALANLPSRDVLLARLMSTMQAPVGQFVRTLNEIPTRMVRVLATIRDAKTAGS